jgi:hypothetical protein
MYPPTNETANLICSGDDGFDGMNLYLLGVLSLIQLVRPLQRRC